MATGKVKPTLDNVEYQLNIEKRRIERMLRMVVKDAMRVGMVVEVRAVLPSPQAGIFTGDHVMQGRVRFSNAKYRMLQELKEAEKNGN